VEYAIGNGTPEPTLTRLVTALERAGAEVADVGKHILPKVMKVLEDSAGAQFDAEGAGPQAGSWAALSPKYASWKERFFPGRKLLVRTGVLADALAASDTEAVSQARRDISGNTLTYGTQGVEYASFHQTGTGRMPARPPFDFGAETEEGLKQAAAEGVREAIKEAWAGLLDFEGDTFEGQEVFSGKRGGRYIRNASGGREYLKRRADGSVAKKSTFNRRGR
ncbi:MAG TPA: hypothetical protein VGE37_02285, partial [Archangium sp.]